MKTLINTLIVMLGLAQTSQAQQSSLWGTGYWGGQQGCSTQQQTTQMNRSGSMMGGEQQGQGRDQSGGEGRSANNQASKTKLKKSQISQYEAEKTLLEAKQERLVKKMDKFFDSEISEFLVQTHLEKLNKCDDYRSYPKYQCEPAAGETLSKEIQAVCDGKDEVPGKLKGKWTSESGGFCNANSNSSRGNVQSSICSDPTLRPIDAPRYRTYSTSECSQTISDYRKNKIKLDQLQEKIEKTEEEISDLELAGSEDKLDSSERGGGNRQSKTEGGCEECALAGRNGQYEKSNRDWWSTAANVAGGLGMIWYGKKIDQSAQAYNAQLGYPSTNSYGYPYVSAGVSTLINGLAGSNGNCSNNVASQYGIGSYGGLNGGYSYSNPYSAFGYPQNSYGVAAGGGIYNSGYNYNGFLNSGLNGYGITAYSNGYYGGINTGNSLYGNYNTGYGTSYSSALQLQQQLQAYSQIPVSQQTPDIQAMIAQLQARISAMSSTSSYNYGTNYGTTYNGVYNSVYYPSSATTGLTTTVTSGR